MRRGPHGCPSNAGTFPCLRLQARARQESPLWTQPAAGEPTKREGSMSAAVRSLTYVHEHFLRQLRRLATTARLTGYHSSSILLVALRFGEEEAERRQDATRVPPVHRHA